VPSRTVISTTPSNIPIIKPLVEVFLVGCMMGQLSESALKRLSRSVLLLIGLGVIATGFGLLFAHLHDEMRFQDRLLDVFLKDYHWRSVGDSYTVFSGLGAVVVGALMVSLSVILAHREPSDYL
jgi:hypothetical protein